MQNRSPKILVIEDNLFNRTVLTRMLEAEGLEVVQAKDGVEGLEAVHRHMPDLVLLDVMMPRMDGFEVIKRLREQPETRALPVLMVTALQDVGDKARGLAAGADDFVTKPYNKVELLARLRSHLRIKELHTELQEKNALLNDVLNRYVSRQVAEEILADPVDRLQLGGYTCLVSVMFVDIRGFTKFSSTRNAGYVINILNMVFARLTPLIPYFNGTLDKYMGDAIMAMYGPPVPQADDALRAVRSAAHMQSEFSKLQREKPSIATLGLGIGICTGEAAVGNVGSTTLMDYTVIGDVANMASRLEGAAQRGEILVDQATSAAIENLPTLSVKNIMVKGRTSPVAATSVDVEAVLRASPPILNTELSDESA